jgi:hypothetical protein
MIIYSFAIAQNDVLKPRISFTTDSVSANPQAEKVILTDKVIYTQLNKPYLFNDTLFKSPYILKIYKNFAFRNKPKYVLKQWNCPIVIYFDSEIPKNVIENFNTFYAQLNQVKNLNISFTKNFEKANYYIKSTSKKINSYSEKYKFKSEEERKNSVLTGATYHLNTDENNKFYSGVLTINITNKSDLELLKQLKQLFFLSLGNFYTSNMGDKNSLLNKNYKKVDYISSFDINLLKMHYINIYDQKINRAIFNKLIKNSN